MMVVYILVTAFFGYWAFAFTLASLFSFGKEEIASILVLLVVTLLCWAPTIFFGRKAHRKWREKHPAPTDEEKAQRIEERRLKAEAKQAERAELQRQRGEAKREAAELKAQQEFERNIAKIAEYVYCDEEQLAKYFIDGELPTVYRPTTLLMKSEEEVRYYGAAVYKITKTKAVGRTSGHRGASIRVAKGVTLHTGGSVGRTVYDDVTDTYNGEIVLTNQRIVFVNPQKGFEVALKSVTAITPAGGEVVIQAKTKAYRLALASSEIFLKSVNQTV